MYIYIYIYIFHFHRERENACPSSSPGGDEVVPAKQRRDVGVASSVSTSDRAAAAYALVNLLNPLPLAGRPHPSFGCV